MASRIAGIVVQIGGDTSDLQKSLKGVDKSIKETQNALKDVNKLLKFDPSNTELLRQKQQLLKTSISETKDRLKALQEAAKNGDLGAEEHDAIQREIIDTQQKLKGLKDEYSAFGSVVGQKLQIAGKAMQDFGKKMSEVGKTVTTKVTVPIVAVGTAAVGAFNEVDGAMDTIVKKTGATGSALEDMQTRARDIAKTMPTSFETAAEAVGEVNTRFGLTGDKLQDLSEKFIKFADLNNTDVSTSVDTVQSTLAAFGLNANQAGLMLDVLNKAGQDTGVSVDALAQSMTTNAASLKEMGYNASDSAMLLANLSKQGVDSSAVMAGLKKAYADSITEGTTLSATLADLEARLQNSDTHAQAAADAVELFGSKAGPQLVDALSSGRMSFEQLGTSMSDFSGSVANTFAATQDPLDNFQSTMNQIKDLGAQIGEAIMPVLGKAIEAVSQVVQKLSEAWNSLSPEQQDMIVKIGLIAAAVGPVILLIGKLVTGIGGLVSAFGMILSPVGLVVAAITALIAIGVAVYKNWDEIKQWASETWGNIKETISGIVDGIKEKLSATWETIKGAVSTAFNAVKTTISNVWNGIKTTVSTVASTIFGTIRDKFTSAKNTVASIFDSIKQTISDKINAAKETVHNIIEKIKGFFNFSWSLPKLKMPHISIVGEWSLRPPSAPHFSISWYKKAMDNAMVLDNATIFGMAGGKMLGGGEAGREVISGESHLMDLIASTMNSAIGARMDGVMNILQTYLPECATQKVAVAMDTVDAALTNRAARRAAAW